MALWTVAQHASRSVRSSATSHLLKMACTIRCPADWGTAAFCFHIYQSEPFGKGKRTLGQITHLFPACQENLEKISDTFSFLATTSSEGERAVEKPRLIRSKKTLPSSGVPERTQARHR